LDRSSVDWSVPPRWSIALLVSPLVGAAAVALSAFHSGVYHVLVREDSVLEWAGLLAYLAAAFFAAWTALRLYRSGERGLAVGFVVLASCCAFAAGEEISWGQRLFDLETPSRLEAVNRQRELTLHNVAEAERGFLFALVAASLYGLVAPWLVAGRRMLVPPVFLCSAFLVTFAYTVTRALFFPHPSYDLAKYSEWPEFCFAFGLSTFALLSWRAARPAE